MTSTTQPDAVQEWQEWREGRLAAVTGSYGPLALAGTYWLADHPDGRIAGLPGRWTVAADGAAVLLEAGPEDGLTVDGAPAAGAHRLDQDAGPAAARVGHGARRLVVLRREGLWAVRDFDPGAPARRAFAGIDAYPYEERWVRPGLFRPYGERRTVQVANADGQERGFVLGGELAFPLDGDEHTLQVAVEPDGSLWAVLADATSGTDSYRFRFLRPPAPAADGTVPVDLNRTQLPPCAFADHFICPFPPPGNTLPFALRAGERNALVD
ncbi:DUF1684 domain-containing protein [Streptomyces yunnanensis]|uniref:DUF1684 domain-containing protein n=1 Tax=Streptomyces yunnanensis TaxID=156453 RepID=A0A9X8QTP8_9ACTN|nr:DUF1684 domain-containing protein [Streptomyces yunnanensis]SHM04759.1 hypothetical protein SAMN05216268_10866 [Streptomyces yunnanensis]